MDNTDLKKSFEADADRKLVTIRSSELKMLYKKITEYQYLIEQYKRELSMSNEK